MAAEAAVAAAAVAAAAAAAEDLRFGGCGEKFGRFRTCLAVLGRFGPFSDVMSRFFSKLQKLLTAETVSSWGEMDRNQGRNLVPVLYIYVQNQSEDLEI